MLCPEKKLTCAVLVAAILSSGLLSACGGQADPLTAARAAVDSAYTLSADVSGTVVQTTDYSPVVANLYRDETRKVSYHVDGDSDTRNMHVSGSLAVNGAKARKDNSYYVTTSDGGYYLYAGTADGKSYTSMETESLSVTAFRGLVDAVADGDVKAEWSRDSTGKVAAGTLYKGEATLEGDQLSYLDNWSRLVATGPLGAKTGPDTADGTADVSIYIVPDSGKLAAVDIHGKDLFRSALELYGQTIYTTTSKYDILVKFSDASVSRQVGLRPEEERKKDVSPMKQEDYQKDRFDLVARKNTTRPSLPDISGADWTDMRLTTGKQDFELPVAYRSVAEDWLFKDASLYNGYQLKDQEYTTVGLYSTVLGDSVTFEATISNDSGKTQDISDCTIVAVSMGQDGDPDNGSKLWLPENITFGSSGGDIEAAYGDPGDGNKTAGEGYGYTSYHYANQDAYLDLVVNDKSGLTSFTMGFVTSGMRDGSNRVDTANPAPGTDVQTKQNSPSGDQGVASSSKGGSVSSSSQNANISGSEAVSSASSS